MSEDYWRRQAIDATHKLIVKELETLIERRENDTPKNQEDTKHQDMVNKKKEVSRSR
jgi:hypothetical protein